MASANPSFDLLFWFSGEKKKRASHYLNSLSAVNNSDVQAAAFLDSLLSVNRTIRTELELFKRAVARSEKSCRL